MTTYLSLDTDAEKRLKRVVAGEWKNLDNGYTNIGLFIASQNTSNQS